MTRPWWIVWIVLAALLPIRAAEVQNDAFSTLIAAKIELLNNLIDSIDLQDASQQLTADFGTVISQLESNTANQAFEAVVENLANANDITRKIVSNFGSSVNGLFEGPSDPSGLTETELVNTVKSLTYEFQVK